MKSTKRISAAALAMLAFLSLALSGCYYYEDAHYPSYGHGYGHSSYGHGYGHHYTPRPHYGGYRGGYPPYGGGGYCY